MVAELEIINFKIPSLMKRQFKDACHSKNLRMTSVINQFIAEFINENPPSERDNSLPLGFIFDDECTEMTL